MSLDSDFFNQSSEEDDTPKVPILPNDYQFDQENKKSDDQLSDKTFSSEPDVQYSQINQQLIHLEQNKQQIQPRDYQIQLFNKTIDQNSIIFLETGKGKTIISMMHMYYYLKKYNKDKKIVFLGSTIQLVQQQCNQIKKQLRQVGQYMENNMQDLFVGMNSDFTTIDDKEIIDIYSSPDLLEDKWTKEKWDQVLESSTILVVIGKILLNALRRSYIQMQHIAIIIFDECHHARQNHPYRQIISEFYESQSVVSKLPLKGLKLLGLTASPIIQLKILKNNKIPIKEIQEKLQTLGNEFYLTNYIANNLHSRYHSVDDDDDHCKKQVVINTQTMNQNENQTLDIDHPNIFKLMKEIVESIPAKLSYQVRLLIQQLMHYLESKALVLLYQLGQLAFYSYLQKVNQRFIKAAADTFEDKECLIKIKQIFSNYLNEEKENINNWNYSIKLQCLLKQIRDANETMVIFVEHKVTAKYLSDILKQEGLNCGYVIGHGKIKMYSLQKSILNQKNTVVTTNYNNQEEYLQNCNNIYEKLKQDDLKSLDEENEKEKNAQIDDQDQLQDQIVIESEIKKNLEQISNKEVKKPNKYLHELVFKLENQNEVIKKFRDKEFNILISTSVTEEGFDIPDCQLVIVYGEIKSFQQYIQQKGRARMSNSKFIVITQNEQMEKKFMVLEHTLKQIKELSKEIIPKKPEQDKNYQKVLIQESKALLNTNWAFDILSNYTHHLSNEKNIISNLFIKGTFENYVKIPDVGFYCILILPKQAPSRYFISDVLNNKEEAKKNAAYKAVKELYIKKELTQDLRPIKQAKKRSQTEFKDDLSDQEYIKILKQSALIKEDTETHLKRRYFPSINNDVFKLDKSKQTYDLYVFEFDTPVSKVHEFRDVNYEKDVQVGFLHQTNFNIQDKKFYLNFQNVQVKFRKVQENLKISEIQYGLYRTSHYFLQATINEWDIQFYSLIRNEPIVKDGQLDKRSKHNSLINIIEFDHAIFVPLIQKQDNNYQIDRELIRNIDDYKSKMGIVYNYLNNIKSYRNHNIKVDQQQKSSIQNQENLEKIIWEKIKPDNKQIQTVLSKYHKNSYIMQNMSENYFMGKIVLENYTQMAELEKENYSEDRKISMKQRGEILQRQINSDFTSNSCIISGQILHKFIKTPIAKYIQRYRENKERKDKFQYFQNEFAKFPLNLKFFFKLKLVYDYALYQIRDYILACKLQNEWKLDSNVLGNRKYQININPSRDQDDQNSQQLNEPVFALDFYKLKDIPQQLIYRALQSKTYNDSNKFNYEVFEFLGDGILKLLASIEVYVKYPKEMEGFLHVKRAKLVSNENLRRIAIKQNVFQYILTDRLDYFPKEFKFNNIYDDPDDLDKDKKDLSKDLVEYRQKIQEMLEKEKLQQKITFQDKELIDVPYGFRYIPEKVHADVIEAINGIFMQHYGQIEACQHFLHCIGLLEYDTLKVQINGQQRLKISGEFNELQDQIGYKFKYRELLSQAFTHISFLNKKKNFDEVNIDYQRIKEEIEQINKNENKENYQSYERLEFLGDAALDAIVVEWLVKAYPDQTPGELSLKKQCIVCNKALALVSIKYKFYKYVQHGQQENQQKFEEIISNIQDNYTLYYNDIGQLYNNEPMVKILGDIFESLVGAIFLDSGFDYGETKRVILKLLEEDFMKHFSSPTFLMKHPQDKLNVILQKNNVLSPKIILNEDELPIEGQYEYQLIDEENDNQVIKTVRAQSEKEASELIYEELFKQPIFLKK